MKQEGKKWRQIKDWTKITLLKLKQNMLKSECAEKLGKEKNQIKNFIIMFLNMQSVSQALGMKMGNH